MPDEPEPFVIRGGEFKTAELILDVVKESYEDGDGAVASVYVGTVEADETYEDALRRVSLEGDVPHGKIRVASLVSLVKMGFAVDPDQSDGQPPCHHNVVFSDPPTLDEAKLFVSCFAAPIRNPARNTAS